MFFLKKNCMYNLSCNKPFCAVLSFNFQILLFCCCSKTLDLIKTNLSYTLSISSCTPKIHLIFEYSTIILYVRNRGTVATTPDRQVVVVLHTYG